MAYSMFSSQLGAWPRSGACHHPACDRRPSAQYTTTACSARLQDQQRCRSNLRRRCCQAMRATRPHGSPQHRLVVQQATTSQSSSPHTAHVPEQEEFHNSEPNRVWQSTAVLRAHKQLSCPVEESGRPLAEYMTLPASQYSVLDAKRIDRIDERTFRCYVDSIRFFGLVIEPILTVSVTVGERGPTVKLLDTRLDGSEAIRAANERFEATMTNVVQWADETLDSPKQISSDTTIQVRLEIPGWMKLLPKSALEGVGSKAMQGVLNSMVPRFLTQLQKDYQMWAAGDESRKPVGSGKL